MGGLLNGFYCAFNQGVIKHYFKLYLGQKINNILGATVQFGMSFLAAKPLGFDDCNTLQPYFMQGFLYLVQFERLYNGLYLFNK